MATFVLIPGAWHGAWSWSEIVPLLEGAGHRVLNPDLLVPPEEVSTRGENPVDNWASQIAALIQAEPEPVVLVGHSRGGVIISEVAERIPNNVRLLIYLAAFLLRDGETLKQVAARAGNYADFSPAVALDGDTLRFDPAKIEPLLYHRTPSRLVQVARERLAAEPAAAFAIPIHVTDERFGAVPRAYIECTDDRAIPLATQREMQAALPCALTVQLESDHSPFFSMPTELVAALETCVREATSAIAQPSDRSGG